MTREIAQLEVHLTVKNLLHLQYKIGIVTYCANFSVIRHKIVILITDSKKKDGLKVSMLFMRLEISTYDWRRVKTLTSTLSAHVCIIYCIIQKIKYTFS